MTVRPITSLRVQRTCYLTECGKTVAEWADRVVLDVVSTAGAERLVFHAECWPKMGPLAPLPGVMLHLHRPTLHPTMRHRRQEMPAPVVELDPETAAVSLFDAQETAR